MLRASVVTAGDGESRCGKTFAAEKIAVEARHQKTTLSRRLGQIVELAPDGSATPQQAQFLGDLMFTRIVTISAGNFFRGAGLYADRLGRAGRPKATFTREDAEPLRELMVEGGILEELQTDEAGTKASAASRLPGVLALCETVFCETVREEYHRDGGGNLVVTDARNPLEIFDRRGLMGVGQDQIDPLSVIPYYIETPAEVAAKWLGDNYEKQRANIEQRRHLDATRPEHPVTMPTNLIDDLDVWWEQFTPPRNQRMPAAPFRLVNTAGTSPEHIQWFGSEVAILAQDLALSLNHGQLVA